MLSVGLMGTFTLDVLKKLSLVIVYMKLRTCQKSNLFSFHTLPMF